jgi:hypothetical protein
MIRWKKLKKLIPSKIKINNYKWEVLWVTEFSNDEHQLGETRFPERQILININQSDKEAVHTFFHEWIHAMDYENGVDLTEGQVKKLEDEFYWFSKFFALFNT